MKKEVSFEDIFNEEEKLLIYNLTKELNSKSILITGSNGFIGRTLALTLANAVTDGLLDCELFLASRNWREHSEFSSLRKVHLLSNNEARSNKFEYEVIFHCASPSNVTKIESLEELRDINKQFLSDCISSKTKNVVYLSSGEVYGSGSTSVSTSIQKPNSESLRSWYPLAKIEAEEFLMTLSSNRKLGIGVVRLFHTFGPGLKVDDGRSFADILWGAVSSKKITLKSDGLQIRTFLYVGDAIKALLMSANLPIGITTLNIGSNQALTIRQFAELVGEKTRSALVYSKEEFEHSPFNTIIPDISKAEDFGWIPSVGIDDAITRTLNWAKNSFQ